MTDTPGLIYVDVPPPACQCMTDCTFPCWQRVGLTGPCEQCGCPDHDD